MRSLLSVLFVLISSIVLAGGPTLNGPSGLISVPTAEALKYKEFNLSFDYAFNNTDESLDDYFYKLNLGTFQNWELGMVGGKVPTEGMFLNVKYYLMSSEDRFPLSIAIGAENLGSTNETDIYMTAFKKLRPDLGVSFGFKAIFGEDQFSPIVMGGASYMVNEQLEWLSDVDGTHDAYFLNTGIRYFLTPDWAVRAYLIDVSNSTPSEMRISLGFSYSKFL